MKRCVRCVLPDTTPGIHLDAEGVCSRCRDYRPIVYRGEAALVKALESFRNPENPYDCCVAVSGGRDSMYALLRVVKDYGLRTLAVNYANPFTHPQAVRNMKNGTRRLGVDMIRIEPRAASWNRTFLSNLRAWLRRPSLAMIPMLCVQCRTMDWDIARVAGRHGVRHIVTGSSAIQDTPFISALAHVSANASFSGSIVRSAPRVLLAMLRTPRYLNPLCLPVLAKSYLVALLLAMGPRWLGLHVTKMGVFSFIKWCEEEVTTRVTNELDWDYPHDTNQPQRFDCPVAYLKNYIYWSALGMCKMDEYYAAMVREGAMSRADALHRLEQDSRFNDQRLSAVLEQTGNDVSDVLPRLKQAAAMLRRQTDESAAS